MKRDELDRLTSDELANLDVLLSPANYGRLTAKRVKNHIASLEREAKAGRELRNNMHSDEGGYFTVLRGHIEAYDTATKETDSE